MEESLVSVALYFLCENALVYGMTYKQFWENGLDSYFIYLKAYDKKRQQIEEDMETAALWNGYYFQQTLLTTPIIALQPKEWSENKTKNAISKYPKKTNWMAKKEKLQEKTIEKRKIILPSSERVAEHNKRIEQIKLRAKLRKN